jgi:hypothetical protein
MIASEVYTKEPGATTPIGAAKAAVPTIDLADRLCGPNRLRRIGEKWTARCPLPDHDERTASFTVYPGDRGWWCYGCGRGGDVVDLARFAWDLVRADEAAGFLLLEFGHTPPERPPAWFSRQARQKPIRDRIEQARIEHVRLLVFRLIWMPWLKRLPEDVREEATEGAWRDSLWMADRLYAGRRSA